MLQVETTVRDLLKAVEGFVVRLRQGEGFDKRRFDRLCKVLRACAKEWSQADAIPKVAANVLVDLFPAIESCSYLPFYRDGEAQRIRDAAQKIGELVRECVTVESHENSA